MAKILEIHPDLQFFREQERRTEQRLRDYLTGPHCRVKPGPILRELEGKEAKFLPAHNPKARREFGSVAARHFGAKLKQIEGPVYFLTFAFQLDLCSQLRASGFDVFPLQSRIREILQGYNFIGMVEVALYGNYGLVETLKPERAYSWHAHVLLWGGKEAPTP